MNVSFFESHLCAFVVVSYFCMLFIQIIKIFSASVSMSNTAAPQQFDMFCWYLFLVK